MPTCSKLEACPFFNDRMKGMDGMAALYKKRFCQGDFDTCARLRVARSGIPVPADLFPNQAERVDGVIAAARK